MNVLCKSEFAYFLFKSYGLNIRRVGFHWVCAVTESDFNESVWQRIAIQSIFFITPFHAFLMGIFLFFPWLKNTRVRDVPHAVQIDLFDVSFYAFFITLLFL